MSQRAALASPALLRLRAGETFVNVRLSALSGGARSNLVQASRLRGNAAAMDNECPADGDVAQGPAANCASAPLKLEEFLPYRLNVVASLVSQALSRLYAERYRIGVPEWRVLVTLGQYQAMTGKAIGAHSHMHKTKVSRAVALLEKRKLVTRRANRADLRESFLSLTPAGRAIYEDLAPIALDFARKLSEVVDPADWAAFERAIDRLTERSAKLSAEVARTIDDD
jgi:DNA-binding MarR family transcriptional regulator